MRSPHPPPELMAQGPPMQIDEIVAWARTDRGGRQLPMFAPKPTGGCMRWGMCETPTTRDEETET